MEGVNRPAAPDLAAEDSARAAKADVRAARIILPALLFAIGCAAYLGLFWIIYQVDLANCATQIAGHCGRLF